MRTIVIATRNSHKVAEIRNILSGQFTFKTLADYPGCPDAVEDADSFEGNARKKAETILRWLAAKDSETLELPWVLADDSGLEVDALGGQPGVLSARFAAVAGEGNSTDAANNAKLQKLLNTVDDDKRTARFRCVIALCWLASAKSERVEVKYFHGHCEGRIAREATGKGGFGYDPYFIPQGLDHSFAELGPEVKDEISHRAVALAQMKNWALLNVKK